MKRPLPLFALALLAAAPALAQGLPDLRGDNLIQLSTNSGFPGDSLTVPVVAANVGTAPAPAFETALYLSIDRFVSDDDIFITRIASPGVSAQSTTGRNVRIAIPNVPRGGYQLLAALDDPDMIHEAQEDNNVNSAPFTVSPVIGGPDLLVSTGDLEDETVAPGGRVSVSYVPANRGASDVGDYEAAYFLAPPNSRPADWILLERETLGGLDAGDDEDESEQVTVPSSITPGQYGFVIVLDDRNLVAESIETNNDYGFGLDVTAPVSGESAPDAAARGLHANPNPAGASVRFTYTLAAPADVRLAVFDALGREVAVVAAGAQRAGTHSASFDASALPPGVYVVRLVTPAGTAAATLTVAR